jgi:tetratricopeptide (TPR) repeat protein
MADVFVSYARGDQPLAAKIAQHLVGAGFTAWWDSALLPHNSFATVIEEEIRAARAVLVIWSEKAIRSEWVRGEAELARAQGKLIQVSVDGSPIPLPFNQYQAADLRRWKGHASDPQWRKVLASVAHFTKAPEAKSSAARSIATPQTSKSFGAISFLRQLPRLWIAGATVVALAVSGGVLVWNAVRLEHRGDRIAVGRFRTIGGAPALKDFAAELSDSLQNVLTQDQLQTVSPSEAEALQGNDLAARAKTLGVGLMFSGTVESKGADVAVSMRLDDPLQHATLWTAEITDPAAQSDQLQARVGALTVAVLNCSAQALASTVRMSDPALQAFLHACELSQTSDHGDSGAPAAYAMLDAMRQATREAPDFAAGHSMLAKHLAFVFASALPDQPSLRTEAEREAHRALQLDPKDPDGFVALGLLAPGLDFARREKLFRAALESNPAWPHANGFLGVVMTETGRLHEGLTLYQRAASVNPQSVDWTAMAAGGLIMMGQTEEADHELAQFSQLWPDNNDIWTFQLESMIAQKRWGDALKVVDRADALGPSISPAWVADWHTLLTTLQSGDPAARNSLRQSLLASSGADPQQAITRLTMLGFVDDAFAVAQHYSPVGPGRADSPWFLFLPEVAALRRDPRFMSLAARFGLVDYWRRTGLWPDFCHDQSLPYSCRREAAKIGATGQWP